MKDRPETETRSAARMSLHFLLIGVIGLFAYANIFNAPFVLDDTAQITENRMIHDLDNFASAIQGKKFNELQGYHYRPSRFMGYLSLALNYRFGGESVTGYHAVNIMIHLLCALLVYVLVLLTFRTPYFSSQGTASHQPSAPARPVTAKTGAVDSVLPRADSPQFIALFAALLFVAHPIQTQAVTYTIQRFASLATLFYLFSVVMYIKGRLVADRTEQGTASSPPVRPAGRFRMLSFFTLSTLGAALAMLTKEIAFTLPVVIVVYEFLFFGSSARKKILFLVPVLLTLIIIPLSIMGSDRPMSELLSELGRKTRVETVMPRQDYLLTQMRVIVTYLRLVFVPVYQNVDYDYPVYDSLSDLPVIASLLFLLTILGTAGYLLYRSRHGARGTGLEARGDMPPIAYSLSPLAHSRLIAFGILWFFITLSVESSIIPIRDVIFEHRLYLPSAGLFIAIAAGISAVVGKFGDRLPSLRKGAITGSLIVIAALTLTTFARNSVWKDEVTLWEDVAAKSPNKTRPRYNLGEAYFAKGQVHEALKAFQDAATAKPDDSEAHYNLGVAYTKLRRITDAINEYQTSIRLDPKNAFPHHNLGLSFMEQGRQNDAIREFKTAIRIRPDYVGAYRSLGAALLMAGRDNEALQYLKTAVALNPYEADPYVNMGIIYDQQGRFPEAAQSFETALNLSPAEPQIHYALARVYVNLNRLEEAVNEFQAAVRIKPDYADAHHDLGAIYYKLGHIQEAMNEFQKVLEIRPDDVDARDNLAAIRKSLGGRPPAAQGVPAYKPPF